MNWSDYREKLGIGFSDDKKSDHAITVILNMLTVLEKDLKLQINYSEYVTYCNMVGLPLEQVWGFGECYTKIFSSLKSHRHDLKDFICHYIAFVNCQKDDNKKAIKKQELINLICDILKESNIPYDIIEDDEKHFLFAKGVEDFDKSLVSDTLTWLKEYPLTRIEWMEALKKYSEATEQTASETADKFRKALERFFQEFFNSTKNLENMKGEYGAFLSSRGIPPEISNNLEKILELYTKYNNNYAKHHNKSSKCVLEYIMYQTGSLIRLLITLKK